MIKEMTGARESNAGDDFHFIWTAKKALRLLEPNTEFEALCVEGPSYKESKEFEDNQISLLSIDVAEYFGGENYLEANKVIFSQLKYSTRHGNEPWSLANLIVSTNAQKNNSIIQRLAQTYLGFKKKYPDDLNKLVLKLVSNRDIEGKFKNLIDKCKKEIELKQYSKYVDLKRSLNEKEKKKLKLFYDSTKLDSSQFIEFILKLDFSDCGTAIREIQEAEVLTSMSKLGILDLKANYNKLIQFIRIQMSPEEGEAEPIKKSVMASFFNTTFTGLFPATSHLLKPDNYVKRDIVKDIVEDITIYKKKHICLHATGGMGKTTVLTDLKNDLPSGSIVLIYDCFGGGKYLDPSTPLHTYKNAIIQLSNELALKCYTPFLVRTVMDESEYLKNFSERLEQASKYIKSINEEAVIVVALDAIDNSFKAADTFKSNCFVENLLKITLPENVCILVTSRTERLKNFELPYDIKKIELQGFNESEQKKYLNNFFCNVTEEQCQEVRRLTDGNPRVQYYVFSKVSNQIEEALEYLSPNGKNLNSIFKEAMSRVDTRVKSDITSFEELCRALVELPRPVPVKIILESTDYSLEKLASACSEYLIGVYFTNKEITFRDEDFEYYLRETAKNGDTVIEKIATTLYNYRFDNYYAIKYLHIFLEKNKDLDKLLESIYSMDRINIFILEDEKNEILSMRIKSAFLIPSIYTPNYRKDVYKLLYLQSKCKATDDGIREMIISNIGLVNRLGFYRTISRFVLSKDNPNSLNNLTIQTYANTLLNNNEDAEESFLLSKEKIKEYLNKSHENRNFKYRIEPTNILQLAMYIALRYGAEDAVKWINSWSPYSVDEYYKFIYGLLINKNTDIAKLIILKSDNLDVFAAGICAYLDSNNAIDNELWSLIETLIENIDKCKVIINKRDYMYRIRLAEVLLVKGKKEEVKIIINNTKIEIDYSYMSFYTLNGELPLEYAFRLYALNKYINNKTYNFDDFWNPNSERINNLDDQEKKQKYNEIKKVIDFIIESFFLRIKTLDVYCNNSPSIEEFVDQYLLCKQNIYKFYSDHNHYDYCRLITKNIFIILLNQEKETIKKYCIEFIKNKYYNNDFHFEIISQLINNKRYLDIGAEYISILENNMNEYPQSAYIMRDFYIKCSQKTILFDIELSKEYFLKAVKASEGVDEESYRRINFFEKLSEKYIGNDNASELVYNFTRIIEDSYRRMDDTKHLPKYNIFKLLSAINSSAAIAAACRLEDRDEGYLTMGYEISIPIIICELLRKNKISVELAVALSNIDIKSDIAYGDIIKITLERLKNKSRKEQEDILSVVCSDIEKVSSGFENEYIVNQLSEWNCTNISQPLKCIKELSEKYSYLSKNSFDIQYNSISANSKKVLWESVDKSNLKFTRENIIKISNDLDYSERYKFIEYILNNMDYKRQLDTIEIIIKLIYTESCYFEDSKCYEVLIKYINKISSYNTELRKWRMDEKKLDEILNIYYKSKKTDKDKSLDLITKIFIIDKEVIVDKVVKRSVEYLNLDAWQILSFMECIATIDNESNCSDILEWCCLQEIGTVHLTSSDEPYNIEKSKNYTLQESIAIYLIKLLGHVEKKKRWDAVHSIYNLYLMNAREIIEEIFKIIFDDIPELFKDKRYVYFKDSAITYFLIAIREIVENNKLFLNEGIIKNLEALALSDEAINILHRELAKEIIYHINPSRLDIITACDIKNKNKIKGKYLHSRAEGETVFRFDTMDIVPHVYYFLSSIFGKSEGQMVQDCDKIISSWNITNEDIEAWNNTFNRRRYQNLSYGLNPPVDNLSRYIQYKAMYYMADIYRKTLPTTYDSIYTFEEWIQKWLTRIQGKLISDLKTVPPNIKEFIDTKRYTKKEKYWIPDSVFNNIYKYKYKNKNYSILSSCSTIEYSKSRKKYYIDMGIMNEKYIDKVVELSQKEANYSIQYNFISDLEEEKNGYDEFIENVMEQYCLQESSIEDFDSYQSGISSVLLKPNIKIEKYFNISNIIPTDYSVTSKNNLPIKSQYWYYDNEDRMYNLFSSGNMLFIEKDKFCQYLKSRQNFVVVVQMEVEYSDGYNSYSTKTEEARRKKIIILDNSLESILKDIEVKRVW